MKDFRFPAIWAVGWCVGVAAILTLSLGGPPPAPDVPSVDKWMHLAAYLVVSVAAVQIFRRGTPLCVVALGLVAMGMGIEVAQGTLLADRTMDWRDALANTLGVVVGVAACELPGRDALMALERRLVRAG